MAGEKILIVEDDPHISNVVKLYLQNNQYDVYTANNGEEALGLLEEVKPNLVILDVQMPGMDGMEVCQEIRKTNNLPIIFLSCKTHSSDKIMGLAVGGDDYVAKPFDPGELLARVKAQLRRQSLSRGLDEKSQLTFPGLVICPTTHGVKVNGTEVQLSAREFQLLLFLAQKPDKVFSMDEIYQGLWHAESFGDNRTIMVHISNLRKKLEQPPGSNKYIITVRGVGYKFASQGS